MNKLHTVTLPTLDDPRRGQVKRRPATALVISVTLHVLLIGILILIPRPSESRQAFSAPPQFTLHFSTSEDIQTQTPDSPPAGNTAPPRQALPQTVHLIPAIAIAHLSPSLPVITISATFVLGENTDFYTESLSPSLEFPHPQPETAEDSSRKSSRPPNGSSGLIAARPLKMRRPVYPNLAREKGYEGTSVFIATINSDGTIENLQLSKTSGHAILDRAAKEALRRWRFAPATRNGITVASQLRIPIIFRLG